MNRTSIQPLPTGPTSNAELLRYLRRVLSVPAIQRIEISPKGVLVERVMDNADDPVVPDGTDDVDIAGVLMRTEITAHPFDPKEHAMYALLSASQTVTKSRELYAVVAPGWPLLSAWLGVETTKEPPKTIFGTKLFLVPSSVTNGRVVLLGAKAPAMFLTDVDMGVAIDLGV